MADAKNTPAILFHNKNEAGHKERVEILLKQLNKICAELDRLEFTELQTPDNIDLLHTNFYTQFERIVLERARQEMKGKTVAGLPLSDAGILQTVQMPNFDFFKSEDWKYREVDFVQYFNAKEVICFNDKTRRYELHPENWRRFIDSGTVYLTGVNIEVWEKLENLKRAMADLNLDFPRLKNILDEAEDDFYPGMFHLNDKSFFQSVKRAYLNR